jgi:hypothetical protein
LHIRELTPKPGERHLVFGRSRSGKSSHQDWEMRTVSEDRPEAMQLLIDTKPRFRAETERMPINVKGRRSAAWRYKNWAKGPVVPNSVVVDMDSNHPFRGIWSHPGEIAILQSGNSHDWRRMLVLMEGFVRAQIKDRERRLIADEVLDFYQRNTFGIDMRHDVFYRTARAGGERNIGLSLGAHRVHGLPPLIIAMMTRITLYHLGNDGDMRYLRDYGIKDELSPEGDFVFRHYEVRPGGQVSDPVVGKCVYPQSYLDQLAAS